MNYAISAFLLPLVISFSAQASNEQFSKLSDVMKAKCSNSQEANTHYKCTLDNEGYLIFLLRYDKKQNDSGESFLSKKVWFNKLNEQLTHVEEYSESGQLKLSVNFDEQQRVKQSKSLTENREVIKNFKELNLAAQHISQDGKYESGFELSWMKDKSNNLNMITKWSQIGSERKVISSFDSSTAINCDQPNASQKVTMLLAEGLNMDIHAARFNSFLHRNKFEKIDGIDNDNNGLIDDCIGFHISESGQSQVSAIIPVVPEDGGVLLGVNHGTMVADIATRGDSKILLYPASGSIRDPLYYQKMSDMIQMNSISLANLSFTFSKNQSSKLDSRESMADAQNALESMIQQNSKTLFVAASGNGPFEFPSDRGINIDSWKQYPASFDYDNILTVGAIETNEIKKDDLSKYELASYSNYGLSSVDILAPGTGIDMIRPGGFTTETTKGTSFAAPYISNLVSQAMILNPSLSIQQIKELLMKTVYIPKLDVALKFDLDNSELKSSKWETRKKVFNLNPSMMPVRSGGIVYPDRFLTAAKWLLANPNKSIEQAAFYVRSLKNLRGPGETGSHEEFRKLTAMWKARGL